MSAPLLLAGVVLTAAAGAVLAGAVRARLSLLERVLLAVVAGVLFGSAVTFGLSLLAGLNVATVLAGPALIAAAGAVAARAGYDPVASWATSLAEARDGWRRNPAASWLGAGLIIVAAVIVAAIFSRTVFTTDGALEAGYTTVWADWSQHLSTASSFAVAANIPPTNPLFSGTPLLYPFLPDFHSATLMVLGASPAAALAVPSGLLVLVVALLVVALGRRLGLGLGGGVVAALIVFLGGGIGFIGLFSDACMAHGFSATQCTFQYVVAHPGEGLGIVGGTLHDLPGAIGAQSRAYDGLPSDGGMPPLPDMQWYTPLMAWWLPQRTIVYGFAAALGVLILVAAGISDERRDWTPFLLAGALIGVLPIVHIQTLLALSVLLLVFALRHRRREWIGLAAVAAAIAAPRLIQVALAPHGAVASGNEYPWFEPGWLANAPDRIDVSFTGTFMAIGEALRQLVTGSWWAFWAANLGLAVPLSVILLLAVLGGRLPGAAGRVLRRATGVLPAQLVELFVGAMVIFALCNLVVFQSWDWDNTKLLIYWYLVAGLVVGALVTRWARHLWRGLGVGALAVTMLLTGSIVMLRFGPWTPPADQVGGPYVIADAQERSLASQIAASTPPHAVFLTFGRPNDPLLAVAGRTAVMGYYGWLWSYGTAFGTRYTDVQAMYAACTGAQTCDVRGLLRRYDVSFVEIDDRTMDPGAVTASVDLTWWAEQGFPVVGHTDHIVVYDVRGAA